MRTLIIASLLITLGAPLRAEPPPDRKDDPIAARLFPPELIMAHQEEVGIDEAQRAALLKEIERAQPPLTRLQWQLQAEAEVLARLLSTPRVDEAKAMAQADKLMGLERELKKAHLGLLIRLKNLLSPAQQGKLAALRQGGR